MPGTSTGFPDQPASAGLKPSCPESFAPQHCTVPSTIAQLVSPPAARAVAWQQAVCDAQRKNPASQVNWHALDTQVAEACGEAGQGFPQLPQLFGSISIEMQAGPPQSLSGAGQLSAFGPDGPNPL
jgi:hypothetical protein